MSYTRVETRQYTSVEGSPTEYLVHLTLSTYGYTGPSGGGGSKDPFPYQPLIGASIVQQVSGPSDLTMPNPITPGNTLVYVAATRGLDVYTEAVAGAAYGYTDGPIGTTRQTGFFGNPGAGDGAGLMWKIAEVGESQILLANNGSAATWYELPGEWQPDATQFLGAIGTSVSPSVGPITAPANSIVFGVAGLGEGGGFDVVAGSHAYAQGTGWTEDYDGTVVSGFHPASTEAHRIPTVSTAVTFDPTGNGIGGAQKWAAQVGAFVPVNPSGDPPAPGQPVPPEVVTMTGPSGTTASPFADGSLHVYVDNLDQTAGLIYVDGSCGEFTLGFSPTPSELVTVEYQGR